MPRISGYELAVEINRVQDKIPIILCTGFGEHINTEKFMLKGVKGFLEKPVSVKKVAHLIRDILDEIEA